MAGTVGGDARAATEDVHRAKAGLASSVVSMPAPEDPLVPADAVTVNDTTIVPDLFRPVAAVVTGEEVRWLTWPSVTLPDHALEEVHVMPTASGAWLLYRSDGSGLEDDEDGQGRSGTVAVHLGPSGVSDGVELNDLRPLGADEGGLWLGDPRDASEWMSDDKGDDEDEDDDAPFDPADIDRATLPRTPEEPFWPDPSEWTEPTDEDADDDDDAYEDGYTWSIGFADADDTIDDLSDADVPGHRDSERLGHPEPLPAPGAPLPTPPTRLVRVAPDGTRTVIGVDHLVDHVRREGTTLVVRYFPAGPRRLVRDDRGGGWWDVVYEPREVRVDVSGTLPPSIDTDALESEPASEEDEDACEHAVESSEARRMPWLDRLDLAGVPGTRWPLWDADEASRASAVDRLRAQFLSLDERVILWTRDHPEPRSAPSDHRNVEVVTDGSWPDTEIVVSFEHTAVPFLRLRRRYRVFDETGRPIDWTYVTVHLEEDVLTALPPRSHAVDGVLDI
jgi:hypothetical protein